MADNVAITPGTGTSIRTDQVGSDHYQVIKLDGGGDGAAVPIVAGQQQMAASLPVVIASDQSALAVTVATVPSHAVTNAGTFAVQAAPMAALLEGGLTELVGIDEQVDQNECGAAVGVALGGSYSGEILACALYATEDGDGAVQDSAGYLLVFDADPTVAAGDVAIAAASWVKLLGRVKVESTDWITDANGGMAYIVNQPVPFHAVSTLYFVWLHKDASSLNDAAGDDEQLEFNFWYRRDS